MCGTRAARSRSTRPGRIASPLPPSSDSPKSSCIPTQMPSSGRPDRARARSAAAETAPLESPCRCGSVADAGDHGERRPLDLGGILGDHRLGARPPERGADAAQVPRAVVGQRDPDACGVTRSPRTEADSFAVASVLGFVSHSDPFVEPVAAPSIEHASRSARPSALNAASATWWSSSPVGVHVEGQACLDREPLERVRQKRHRQAADAVAAEGERDLRMRPADEVDGRASPVPRPSAPSPSRTWRRRPGRRARRLRRRRARRARPRPCGARRPRGRRRRAVRGPGRRGT